MRLRKADWLGELQGLAALVGVVAAVATAMRVVMLATGSDGVAVELWARRLDGVAGDRPDAGVTVPPDGTVDAVITDPSGGQLALSALSWLPTTLLVIAVVALLFRLLRDARRADPFTRTTVRRLRVLAAVALVGGIVAEAAESIGATALIGTVPDAEGGFYAELTLPIGWVMLGFGFLAVGELIRRGCALRDELAGVI